jgi:fibronectin-binding autotransporter adhesin
MIENYKISRFLLSLIFTALISTNILAVDYFSQGVGDFHILATWNDVSDGSGVAPASINVGDNFFIQNGDVITVAGGNAISINSLTITDGSLVGNDNLTLAGNLDVTASGAINMNANTLNLAGAITNSGTVDFSNATVNYNGAGAQTALATTYGNLEFSGGAKNLAGNITTGNFTNGSAFNAGVNTLNISGNYTSSGTDDLVTATIDYNGGGSQSVLGTTYGTLTLSNAGTKTANGNITVANVTNSANFAIGANTLAISDVFSGAGTYNFTTGTVQYTGGAQDVLATTYGDLEFSGGAKTLLGNITTGDLTNGSTFNAGANALNISGDYTSTGTDDLTAATVNYNGVGAQNILSTTYATLNLSGGGTKTASGNITTTDISNTATFNLGANTLTVSGDFTGAGTNTMGAGTVDYNGAGNQIVAQGAYGTVNFLGGGTKTAGGSITATTVNNAVDFALATNTLNISGALAGAGTYDFTTGTVNYTGAGAQTLLSQTYGNLGLSGAGTKTYAGTISTGNLTNTGATFDAGVSILNISGNYTSSGADDLSNATVDYTGAGAQTVLGTTYNTLTLSNAGTKTAGGNITTTNVLNAVTFALGANTLDISGAFSGAGTYNFATGTVQYTGGAQDVLSTTYANLEFSNGVKTLLGDITTGNLTNTGTNFDLGGNTLNISGTYSSTGTDVFNAGTVNYNGVVVQNVFTAQYNDLVFSGGGTKTASSDLDVNGNLTINDATTFADGGFTHSIAGNWSETDAGAIRTGNGAVIFDGGGISIISGVTEVRFNEFTTLGVGTIAENSVRLRIDGNMLINTGTSINQDGQRIDMRGPVWEELGTGATTSTGNDEVRFRRVAGTIIRGDNPINFDRMRIRDGGFVTLEQNIVLDDNLVINNNSALDMATFTATGGSSLLMNGANSLLRVGGASNFPTGFNNATFTVGTVEYYFNGAQDITGNPTVDYNNIQITGTGDKTVQSDLNANFIDLDAGNLISNNFNTSSATSIDIESGAAFIGGNGTVAITTDLLNGGTFTQGAGNLTVADNFTNEIGATFTGGNGTITVTDDFTNNANFDRGAGAITITTGNFLNSATGVLDAGTGNLTVTNGSLTNNGTLDVSTGGNVAVSNNSFINGNGATFTGGAGAIDIANDLTSGGTFTGGSGAIDINGNVVIGVTGSFTESSSITNVEGNLTSNGTFNQNGGTFTFDGAGNSVLDGGTINFNNLVVDKATTAAEVEINDGTVIVNANTSLNIIRGTFDFQEFGGNGHQLGTVSGTADAIIALAGPEGGAAVFPMGTTDLTSFVTTPGTTINFNTANNYTIPNAPPGATNYQNIILSGGGTKTATGAFDINGTITINDATTFADAGFTHTVAGNWTETNAGAGLTGTGTVLFDGNSTVTATAGTLDFNNIEIATGVTVTAGASDLTLTGDWTENGTGEYIGTGTINFTGAIGSINGTAPIILPNVNLDNGDQLTLNQSVQIPGDLTLSTNSTYETNTFTTTGGGNDINLGTDVTVRVGGADNFPSGFNPVTFTSGLVEYYANGAQAVAGTDEVTYFNLQSTGTGDKTAQNNVVATFIDLDVGTLVSNNFNITSSGDMDIEAGAGINASSGGNINSGDDILNDGSIIGGAGTITTADDITNTGSFVQGTGNITVGGDMVNGGAATFDGGAGTITIAQSLTNNGDFDRGAGAITITNGNLLNGGTFDDGTGSGNLTVSNGNITNDGTMGFTDGNVAVNNGFFTNSNGATFTSGTGTVVVEDDLTNSGTFTGGAGNITVNTGVFTNNTTGTFTGGTGDMDVTLGVATNEGIVNLSAGGDFAVSANSLTNGVAAQFTSGAGTVTIAGDLINDATGAGFYNANTPNGATNIAGLLDNNALFNTLNGAVGVTGEFLNSGTFNGNTGVITTNSNFTNEAGGTITPGTSTFSFATAGDIVLTDVDQNPAKFSFFRFQIDKDDIANNVNVAQGTIVTANSTHFVNGSLDLFRTDAGSITQNHDLGSVTIGGVSNANVSLRMNATDGTICQFPDGDFVTTFMGNTGFFETENSLVEYNGGAYTLPTIVTCYNRLTMYAGGRDTDPGKEMSGDICVDEYFFLGRTSFGTTDNATLYSRGFDITITGIASDTDNDLFLDRSTLNLESGSTLILTNGNFDANNQSRVNIGDALNAATGANVIIQGADGDGDYDNNNSVFNMYGISDFQVNDGDFTGGGSVTAVNTAEIDIFLGDYNRNGVTNFGGDSKLILRTGSLDENNFNGNANSEVLFLNTTADQQISFGGNDNYTFANLILAKNGFDLDLIDDIEINGTVEMNIWDDEARTVANTAGGNVLLNDENIRFGADADITGRLNPTTTVSFQDPIQTNAIASFDADRMFVMDGTVNTGALIFEGDNNISTSFEGIYPVGSSDVVGALTPLNYNYFQIANLDATQDGVLIPEISIKVIPYTSGQDDVLNKYWEIVSDNIISIVDADLTFKYYDSEINRITADPLLVKRTDGGVEFDVLTGAVDEIARTFTSDDLLAPPSNTFLETEWRLGVDINLPQTYYSFKDGNWDTPDTWTKDPFGLTQTPADYTELTTRGSGPGFGDNVYIINGRNVRLESTTGAKQVTLLAINDGEVFIPDGEPTHQIPTIIGEANGRLRINNDNELPNGDYTDFVAADGGTFEFQNNTATRLDINTTQTLSVFNHVILSGTGPIRMDRNYLLNGNFSVTETVDAEIDDDMDIFGGMFIESGARVDGLGTETIDLYGDLIVDGVFEASSKIYPDYINDIGNRIEMRFLGDEPSIVNINGLTTFDEILVNKTSPDILVEFNSTDPTFTRFNSEMDANSDDEKAFEIARGTLKLNENIIVPTLTEGGVQFIIEDNAILWINGAEVHSTTSLGTDRTLGVEVQGKLLITSGFLNTRASRGIWFNQNDDAEIEIDGGTLTANAIFTENNSTANGRSRGSFVLKSGTVNLNGTGIVGTGQFDANATFSLGSSGATFVMNGGEININGTSLNEFILINADESDISVTDGIININSGDGGIATNGKPFYDLSINNPATTVTFDRNTNVIHDLIIGSGTTLDANTFDLSIQGDLVNNSGTYTPNGNTTIFNSDYDNQEVQGIPTFNNLRVDNTYSGGVLSISALGALAGVTNTGNLEVLRGGFYAGKEYIVNGNITNDSEIFGPQRIKLTGGAAQHIISGDGTGVFRSIELDDANGVSFTADQSFENTILMTNGVVELGVFAMKLGAVSDLDDGGAGFDNSRMVTTAGNASDGGIQKTFSSAAAFLFPVGTGTDYTPATLNLTDLSPPLVPTYGMVQVSPVTARHPLEQGAGNALTYYWDLEQTGFSNVNVISTFTYAESDVQGTEADYISARYTGTWNTGLVTDVDETNNIITFSGVDILEGAFTVGEITAFPAPTTYYSRNGGGNWSNTASWTLNATHTGGEAGSTPTVADKVVIGDNDIIIADADNLASGSIVIENGSTLDIGGFIGHNFGDYEGVAGEEGELRISIDQTITIGVAVFPSGDWGEFLGTDGGTVEYYEPRNTGNSVLELPANISTYYNLRINNNRDSDSRRIFTNTQKLTIYNDLVLEDNSILDNNLGEFRIFCDLDIRNDFRLEGAVDAEIQNNGNHEIRVGGDFSVIDNRGLLTVNGNAIHDLYISGNLINNGELNLNDNDARMIRVHFIGNTNSTWTGGLADVTTNERSEVSQLIVDFDDSSTKLTISDPKFYFNNTDINIAGFSTAERMNLRFIKGIVEFQEVRAGGIFLRDPYELPSDGEIWVNGPTVELQTNGNFSLEGILRVTDGTMNIGNGTNERLEPIVGGRTELIVEGGTLNVSAQVRRTTFSTLGALKYNQSAGTVNVGLNGANTNARGVFEVTNSGSSFEMSGGELVIGRSNGNGGFPSVYLQPETSNVTGGTLVIGNVAAGTPAGDIELNSTIPLFNVRVDNGANNGHVLQLVDNPLVILNDLDIEGNTTLEANGQDVFIAGDYDNQGTYDFGTNTTYFNNSSGVGTQDLTASGAGNLDFANVTVVSQTTVRPIGSDITVNRNLDLSLGTLQDNGQRITVRRDINNTSLHASTGGGEILVLNDDLQRINGDGTGIFGNIRLDNGNNVLMTAKARINGTLGFTNGNLLLNNFELTLGQTATISGANASKMIVTDGVSTDGGVIKEFLAGAINFTFPVGDGSIFTPANFQSGVDPTTDGQIRLIRVATKHPATQDPAETQLNYYWKVNTTFTDGTFTHQYTYDQSDVPATLDESDASAVVGRFFGAIWTEGTTDVGTFNATSNIITVEPGGGPAIFLNGDYTIGYDLEFDLVPQYRSNSVAGAWETVGDWEVFDTTIPNWVAASLIPPSGSIITIQNTNTMVVSNPTTILATSVDIEPTGILDLGITAGHDFTILNGTGKLKLASSNFPAGVISDFVSVGGGTVEYGQGTGGYTMPAVQVEYNNLIINSNGNTVNLSSSDLKINGDFTIDANATLSNATNRINTDIQNGNWINNGSFIAGTELAGETPTVKFSSSAVNQTIGGASTTSFYNLEFDKSPTDLVTDTDVTVDGKLLLTSGSIDIADDLLTVNGEFSGSGTIKGSNTASLAVGGTAGGSAGTINFAVGANELNDFTLNRVGVNGAVTIGADVTVRDVTTLTTGELVLDGGTITIDGTIAAGGAGSISGTCTGGVILSDSGGGANDLVGELRFTTGKEELGIFTMDKPSIATLGSNLTVCTALTLTRGELQLSTNSTHTLTVNGTYSRTTGTFAGSANSNLTIDNGALATTEIVFADNAKAILGNFTLNKSVAGPSFSTGDATDEMLIAGVMELQGTSVFDISGDKTLELTGYTNGSGSLRGSTATILNIGGTTNDPLGILNFEAGNRIVKDLTMNRTGGANGTATLGTDLEVDDVFTATLGAFELNDNRLTLSGTLARTDGTFTGSNGSDMVIDGAPNDLGGEIYFTAGGGNTQRLRDFTMAKVGDAILGTDLTIRRNLTTTSGQTVLPSGTIAGENTLTLLGNHIRGTGTLTGSTESHVTILGNGDLGDPLFFTGGAEFVQELIIDRSINGVVELGTDLRIGETADTDGVLTMSNGEFDLNDQTLTIVTDPAGYSRANGTFTGSANSRMVLDGTGDLGSRTATGTLHFTNNGAEGQILKDLVVARGGNGEAYLGTDLTIYDETNLSNPDFSFAINGNTFTINGTPTPATNAVGKIGGDVACGSTSRLIMASGQGGYVTRGLNTWGVSDNFFSTIIIDNNHATERTATLIPNSTLNVCDTMNLISGNFGLGGASGDENFIQIGGAGRVSGAAGANNTYVFTDASNSFTGSKFSNLTFNNSRKAADDLGGDSGKFLHFTQTGDGMYIKSIWMQRRFGTNDIGSITLGSQLIVGDETVMNGTFQFNGAELILNDQLLTLNLQTNGFRSFGYSAANAPKCIFRGSADSELVINGPGRLNGDTDEPIIFRWYEGLNTGDNNTTTFPQIIGYQTLKRLEINRTGDTDNDIAYLGSNLTIEEDLDLVKGVLALSNFTNHSNNRIFTINGRVNRLDTDPTTGFDIYEGARIRGGNQAQAVIGGSGSVVSLFIDAETGAFLDRSLHSLTINRTSHRTLLRSNVRLSGGTLAIATGAILDLETNYTDATAGRVRGINIGVPISNSGANQGTFGGSYRSEILFFNNINHNDLRFAAGENQLRRFRFEFSIGNTSAVRLTSDLTVGTPIGDGNAGLGFADLNGRMDFVGNGNLIFNGNILTFNSTASNFVRTANGRFTGDFNADFMINGTGATGDAINFATGAERLEIFTLNRTATGTATLGTLLEVGDPSIVAGAPGNFNLTNGTLIMANQPLRIANDINITNGRLRGRDGVANTILNIRGRGETDALVFDVTTLANHTLGGLIINRSLNDAGVITDIDLGSDVRVGINGSGTSGLELTDADGVLSLEGSKLTLRDQIYGTGNLRGSFTSDLAVEGVYATNTGTLNFKTDNLEDNYLQTFSMNRILGTPGSVTMGTDLNIGEPNASGNQFNGEFDLTAGSLVMNSTIITINSTANNFTSTANGSFTGDYSADLILNGTGDLGNPINFASGAERLEIFEINRSASTDDVALGTDLIMGNPVSAIPSGHVQLQDGTLELNGNSLTINNEHIRTNGFFRGSNTSEMIIGGREDFNPLFFDTSSDANKTLLNLAITRTLNNAGTALDIDLGTDLIVGVAGGTGELDLNPSTVLSIESNELRLNGDLAENDGTIRGSNISELFVGGQDAITGTLKMTTGNRTLDLFSINRSGATANITLGTDLTLDGATNANSLTLTDGLVTTTTANLMTLNDDALVTGATYTDGGSSGGSDASYINGPIAKDFASDLGTYRFPIGKNSTFLEAGVKDMNAFPTTFRAEYFDGSFGRISGFWVRAYPETDPRFISRVSSLEYWDIDQTAGTSNAKIVLHWNADSEVTDPNILKIGHFYDPGAGDGELWEGEGLSVNFAGDATGGYHISAQDISYFSPFTHATTVDPFNINPLPITLASFDAEYVEGKGVRLFWKTLSEINNKGFILKRSIGNDGDMEFLTDYNESEELVGAGDSKEPLEYAYWDEEVNLKAGESHYYQLFQKDFDGKVTAFRIRVVNIGGKLELYQNYPNPAKDETTLSFSLDKEREVSLAIYNQLGQLIYVVKEGSFPQGTHEVKYNTRNLATGTYVVRLVYGEGQKTKKMLIVK